MRHPDLIARFGRLQEQAIQAPALLRNPSAIGRACGRPGRGCRDRGPRRRGSRRISRRNRYSVPSGKKVGFELACLCNVASGLEVIGAGGHVRESVLGLPRHAGDEGAICGRTPYSSIRSTRADRRKGSDCRPTRPTPPVLRAQPRSSTHVVAAPARRGRRRRPESQGWLHSATICSGRGLSSSMVSWGGCRSAALEELVGLVLTRT